MTDTASYLRKLFKPKESICYTDDSLGWQVATLETMLEQQPRQFVSVNPLHPTIDFAPTKEWHRTNLPRRADHNVTEYRNFLIEFDKYAGTETAIPLDEQHSMLVDMDVPYTTLTFSGSKSLHAVICLSEPVTRDEYIELAKLIRVVLWHSDPTQKNPSRLTRVAGALRGDVEQSLIDVRKRVTLERVESWLSRFERHIVKSFEREQQNIEQMRARQASLPKDVAPIQRVEPRTISFLDGSSSTKSSRHARLVAACFELFECGVEYEEALQLVAKAADLHGITADPRRAREADQIVNYVYGARSINLRHSGK